MMKRQVISAAVLGAAWLALVPDNAFGFGGRFRSGCGGGTSACAAPCNTGCGGTANCGGCAPAPVTYVDREVTVYETKATKKMVEVTTMKLVSEVQKYEYIERTPVKSQQKRTVTEYTYVTTPQSYKYYVTEVVPTKEKRTVTEYKMVPKEVEVDVVTCVPETTNQKRTVQKWVCQPKTVTAQVCVRVPVAADPCAPAAGCGTCATSCNTGCGRQGICGGGGLFGRKSSGCGTSSCNTGCNYTTQMQTVTRTVMERVCVTEEITVPVTTYKRVVTKQKKTVNECVPTTREVEVTVNKCVAVEKTGTRNVCECKPVTKDIMVDVWTCKEEKKTGERTVQVCKPVKEQVETTVYECVPVKKTVKVAVAAAAACNTGCGQAACSSGCGSGRGGFRLCGSRKSSCGCN